MRVQSGSYGEEGDAGRIPLVIAIAMTMLVPTMVGMAGTVGAEEGCAPVGAISGCYFSIQDAIDKAGAGEVVVVRASSNAPNPTPYVESLVIPAEKTGLTLCSTTEGDTAQEPSGVFIAPDDSFCETPQPEDTVIDPQGQDTPTIKVDATDVTIRGFTIKNTDLADYQPDEGPPASVGIVQLNGAGATLAKSQVIGNNDDDQDFWDRQDGVDVDADGATIIHTTIERWGNFGVTVGADTTITSSTIHQNTVAGLWVGDHVEVHDSTIGPNGENAVRFNTGENTLFRGNDILPSLRTDGDGPAGHSPGVTFHLTSTHTGSIDAKANYWGVVGRDMIPQTWENPDETLIEYMPYEDADDALHPPAPKVLGDACSEATPLTLDEAVAAAQDTPCTIVLSQDVESYDGATVSGKVTILPDGELTRDTPSQGEAHIRAIEGRPALKFTGDSLESTVTGISIANVETGATAIQTAGLTGTMTLENLRVVGPGTGVYAEDGTAPTIEGSTFVGQSTPVLFEDTSDGRVADNTIVGDEGPSTDGITLDGATGTTVTGSTIQGTTVGVHAFDGAGDLTIAGNQINAARTGILTTDTDAVTVEDNVLAGRGLYKPAFGITPSSGVEIGPGTTGWTVTGNLAENWGFAGVHVNTGAEAGGLIEHNQIRDTWQFGVYVGDVADVQIVDNELERAGFNGINLERSADTVVRENLIRLNALPGGEVTAEDESVPEEDLPFIRDDLDIPAAGLWVQGATGVTVEENIFSGDAVDGILVTTVGGDENTQPTLEPLRSNEFVLLNAAEDPSVSVPAISALRIGEDVSGLEIDARLNDWGVYEYQLVQKRAIDQGDGNSILQLPYLMPNGAHGLPAPSLS